jgi:type IV pilus assembly protein PilB
MTAKVKNPWLLELLPEAARTVAAGATSREIWLSAVKQGVITDQACMELVSSHFRLEAADLSAMEPRTLRLIPESIARLHGIVPIGENDRQVFVATCDPNDIAAEQAVAFSSGRYPVFRIASPSVVDEALLRYYGQPQKPASPEPIESKPAIPNPRTTSVAIDNHLQGPVTIRTANGILRDAIRLGVSDIHIEPAADGGVVRFRIDGVMRTHMSLPLEDLNQVVSRLKVLAKLDIASRHRPQDGRTRVVLDDRHFDLRLSTVPIRNSEKAVIRLLDPSGVRKLEDVGVPVPEMTRIRQLMSNRDGIVLVTGPTGSGKTTTLYAAIRELSTGETNIMTVEDPVEYELKGVSQIQVDARRGVTFASALRAVLRQDPDVIFVGEIRDLETAEMAVQASMTGHLVLASVHANDAASAVTRLQDLGLDRASIASTLRGAIAQRLMRRLCEQCAQPVRDTLTEAETELARLYDVRPTRRAVGCKECSGTGYRGRMPIMEVITFSSQLSDMVGMGRSAADVSRSAALAGMRSLKIAAIARVRYGETTLDELHRVLGESNEHTVSEPRSSRLRALLADDDPINRRVARSILEKNGFDVAEAADGMAALERLSTDDRFDLMLLDMRMPRLGGVEVLSRMRKSSNLSQIPVIVLTGNTEESTEIQMMEMGAEDYLRKPLDSARFMSRVKAVMRRRGKLIQPTDPLLRVTAAGQR